MSPRVGVVTSVPDFRVAVEGLPLRAEQVGDPRGAIVIVDGGGRWWDAAERAVRSGARAVLVADPARAPIAAIDDLGAGVEAPVLVHRPRIRRDLAERALQARGGMRPRLIVAECRAEPDGLHSGLRDAIGWVRLFAERSLELVAGGGAALLRPTDGSAPIGTVLTTTAAAGGTVLRVRALGETTSELELDEPRLRCELATSTVAGRLIAPALHETPERAALRRALDIVASGAPIDDLALLRHDAGLADAAVSARRGL